METISAARGLCSSSVSSSSSPEFWSHPLLTCLSFSQVSFLATSALPIRKPALSSLLRQVYCQSKSRKRSEIELSVSTISLATGQHHSERSWLRRQIISKTVCLFLEYSSWCTGLSGFYFS